MFQFRSNLRTRLLNRWIWTQLILCVTGSSPKLLSFCTFLGVHLLFFIVWFLCFRQACLFILRGFQWCFCWKFDLCGIDDNVESGAWAYENLIELVPINKKKSIGQDNSITILKVLSHLWRNWNKSASRLGERMAWTDRVRPMEYNDPTNFCKFRALAKIQSF